MTAAAAVVAVLMSITGAAAAELPVTAGPLQFWDATYVLPQPKCDRPGNGTGNGHDKPHGSGKGPETGRGHECDSAVSSRPISAPSAASGLRATDSAVAQDVELDAWLVPAGAGMTSAVSPKNGGAGPSLDAPDDME